MAKLLPVGRGPADAAPRRPGGAARSQGTRVRSAPSEHVGLQRMQARFRRAAPGSASRRARRAGPRPTGRARRGRGRAGRRRVRAGCRARVAPRQDLQAFAPATRSARARAIRAGSGLSSISSRMVSATQARSGAWRAGGRPPVSSRRSSTSNWSSKAHELAPAPAARPAGCGRGGRRRPVRPPPARARGPGRRWARRRRRGR